ncbi:MAG TPA: VTT domain-containing protein [Bryobacteraceae bacterium]|nr:VTT domain-containing protein [Bryobacteraceae bacterium]
MLAHLTQILVAWGPLGVLLLSILDSSGVPVAGAFDALLILIAIERPATAWWCAGIAVVGSSIGNMILFSISRRGGRRIQAQPAEEGKSRRFRAWFLRYGLLTVFVPAMIPIPMPMKVFVITAGVLGTPLMEFLGVIVSARIVRYFGEVWLGVKLGHDSTAFLKSHAWQFVGSAVAMFAFLYGVMVWRHRNAPPEL